MKHSIFIVTIFGIAAAFPCFASDLQSLGVGGHLYMQTNGIPNEIIHYERSEDGQLVDAGHVQTGGLGSGTFKPITSQENAPNAFESIGSVLLSADHKYLFVTNGGNNTVSSFAIGGDGTPTLLDCEWTGQTVSGQSGTAKSLAYSPETQTLYVGHAFGPDHIHAFFVHKDGKLELHGRSFSVNTDTKTDRVISQITLTPDGRFLLVDVLFDQRPGTNPDGSANLQVANTSDGDGLAIFPVRADGDLAPVKFANAGGAGPFAISFFIYPNASKLIAYHVDEQGGLQEIQEVPIPYNTPIGLDGI